MTTIPRDISVSKLDATEAFNGLTATEKLYAYHIGKASWEGAKICLFQCSYEAPAIFSILQLVIASQPSLDALKEASGVDDEAWADFLTFAAAFYANMGNFKSFGDIKIIPGLPAESFFAIIQASEAFKAHGPLLTKLWSEVRELLYSTTPVKELGFPPAGTTGYYSSNAMKEDAELIQKFLDAKGISGYNTRLVKEEDGSYTVRQASSEAATIIDETWDGGVRVKVVSGDHGPLMARVVSSLEAAKKHAANAEEEAMTEHFVRCFRHGSIEEHKEGSRQWIRDKGPRVESYIGYIESYRDPLGVRGEWEGFVAVVNRAMSAKFNTLVEAAESLLTLLPWPTAFEKDRFLRPDFTSLDVIAFGSGGIPAGINLPNYDDIRQNEGFKNVSLGNVLSASLSSKVASFLRSDNGDDELFRELVKEAFEVQVGLHELLGHGSGKLFCQSASGELNFDPETTVDPLTDSKVSSFYKAGETWDSKFPVFGSAYEECRAECVGIYLCTDKKVLSIFGHEGDKADNIVYINWLNMARAGLMGLEFFRPETGTWGQAHMQARFTILRVLLEAGQGLVSIVPDEEKGVLIHLARDKIRTVGLPAIEHYLRKIQVYKSTADYTSAKAMFVNHYSHVPEDLLRLRDTVLAKKKERPLFVQPHLVLSGAESVELVEFPATVEGVLASFAARYPPLDQAVLDLWEADKASFGPRACGGHEAKRSKNGGK